MEILEKLFYGFPELWGGGVAHSVMILALVITLGLCLGKVRVRGVSLGLAWVLFIGLLMGNLPITIDEHLLHFLKEFGLILFVYSIGLEVGPGFFSSFRGGGKSLNILSIVVGIENCDNPRGLFLLWHVCHDPRRHPLGCRDQYPGTGCGTAGFQRPAPH